MQASLANPLFSTDASRPARAASSAGLRPVALAVLTLLAAPALAQTSAPLQLQATPLLAEKLPANVNAPSVVLGDRISGRTELETVIEGNAELRQPGMVARGDKLVYDQATDVVTATGGVRVNREGDRYTATSGKIKVDAVEGFFLQPTYEFIANGAHGQAERLQLLDRDRSTVFQGTYTTCQRQDGADWRPDWILRADRLELDREDDEGRAHGAVLEFKGVPILPMPTMSFPLGERRKSGWLPPTIGLDNKSGLNLSVPYYWNIAPNRDATLRAALMTKRGANLGGEFRYLEPTYSGEISADVMPNDRLRDRMRWGFSGKHDSVFFTGLGGVGLNLNIQRVSDDNYWRDFGRAAETLRQRLLPGDATLNWAAGDMQTRLRVLKWQTLQDVAAPIVPPFDRMPQLQWRYAPTTLPGGFDGLVELDTTRFQAARELTRQPNADRSYALVQISRPFLAPAGFLTPRMQLHATQYQFDTPLSNGDRSASRTLPTFSLDSGLVFERDTAFFGRPFLQTLEPRAFYTYTPYRDQSRLPVYDTAANDFNFATIYTENAFGGNDRLADNNLLTLGVSTRLLDPDSGAEAARFGIAQRVRFSDQKVTLPGVAPVSERLSDVLLGAGITWTPQWGFDSTVQYNPKTGRSIRSTIGARYSPGNYRTVSAAYRLQRGTSEQIDVGWQWPLNALWGGDKDTGKAAGQGSGRWYSVGRLNYSLQDRKLVDTVVGLEYDSCCWIGRVVLERLQSGVTTANTRLLFQIEFVGFSRLSLGSSPLDTFKQNVPRYQALREQVSTPSRFSTYD